MEETVRYSYRLRPGKQAVRFLEMEANNSRWLWNEACHQMKSGQRPTANKLCSLLTEARGRLAWLREGSSVSQQQTLNTFGAALNHSFKVKGRGKPKIKKKNETLVSLQYTTRGFRIKDGLLCLPNKVTIPVVWSRELPSEPSSVRVTQDSLGHWYASFVVKRTVPDSPEVDGEIGIDWGVVTTATTTDPAYDLPYQGFRKRCASELAKAQKKMSRRHRKGVAHSSGYLAAKRSAAKLHRKAARQNKDVAHKWAKRVVDNHQVVAIEDFKPGFLGKTRMARKAADAAIGTLKAVLVERGNRAGRTLVMVAPAYTTMTCGSCFARNKLRLPLSQRVFECESCGYTASRDRNAAEVILKAAKRELSSP